MHVHQMAAVSLLFWTPLAYGADPSPQTEWLFVDDDPRPGLSDPLVAGEMVVVGSDSGLLRAFDAHTGKEIWRYAHNARIFHRPECDERRIFVISELNGAVALDRRSGLPHWRHASQLGYGAIAVCREANRVFLAGNDGVVRALDSATGRERWAANFLGDAPADPPGVDGNRARFQGKPARPNAAACDGEWVFVSVFDQSRVVAFDVADGSKKFDYQAGGWIWHSALIDGDRVFIGSQDDCLHCVDRATSKVVWRLRTDSRVESSAAVHDGKVYFGSCDGRFYCVNRETGAESWIRRAD